MNTGSEQYFRNVKRQLNFPLHQKKKILMQIQNGLYEFQHEQPNCTYGELAEHFGPPELLIEECLNAWGLNVIECVSKRSKRWMLFAAALIVCAVLILMYAMNSQSVSVTELLIQLK